MHPQTLRKYERLGLVRPTRTIGSMRVLHERRARAVAPDQAPGRRGRGSTWPACSGCCRSPRRSSGCASCCRTVRADARAIAQELNGSSETMDAIASRTRSRVQRRMAAADGGEDLDGIQGLLPDARRRQDRVRQGDQAGVPEAGAQAPSRRQPRRQVRRGEVQGDQRGLRSARRCRQAPQVRRARRELADVRAGAAAGPGLRRRQSVRRRRRRRGTSTWAGPAAATAP